MKQIEKIRNTYENIKSEATEILSKTQKQIYRIGTIRVILFLAGIAGIIYFWNSGWLIIGGVILCTFVPFLILVKYHNKLFYKKEYLEKKIEINVQELQALNYDNSSFDGGEEFIDPAHLYSYDLDVFGDNSLFQSINRTSTMLGKKRLAEWFSIHLENKTEIEKRQEAVKELAPEVKFRQRFRILGLLFKNKTADKEEIEEWAKTPAYYKRQLFYRLLPPLVLTTNIILIGLAIAGIISFTYPSIVFTSFFLISLGFSQGISKVQNIYGKKMQILGTYARLIQLIEEKEFKSEVLVEVKNMVTGGNKTASQSVNKLVGLMNALDQRSNMFMLFILNGLMFWEMKQMMRIETWKEKNAGELPHWLEAIAYMDAMSSLATFSYNNPDFTYPEIIDKPFCLEAQELGHPLMNRNKCVLNDIRMNKRPYFIIITGANMAGKSTYLRTVGVNFLLACIGASVFAVKMKISPVELITSLRTTDSLTDNESYFFAELKRMKLIIDKLNAGEELFIILDEILKGTNSIDKQKGSFALITQFMELNANGIIATHDLLLGTLIESFPDNISNYRFEADITDNELTFSYQLREGVAENMNACFLMKKMGIAVAD